MMILDDGQFARLLQVAIARDEGVDLLQRRLPVCLGCRDTRRTTVACLRIEIV